MVLGCQKNSGLLDKYIVRYSNQSLPEETAKRFKKDSTPRVIQNEGASPTSGLIQLTALMVEMKTCHVLKVEKG